MDNFGVKNLNQEQVDVYNRNLYICETLNKIKMKSLDIDVEITHPR